MRLTPDQLSYVVDTVRRIKGHTVAHESAILDLADALDAERKARREAEEAMLAIVENEPEFPDDPPAILMDAFGNLAAARGTEGAVVELMRLSVRETKWCIAEKIRSLARAAGEGKAEPKPEPRDPRACPTCGSLSTFNGACMKCHEDYAMGGG